ncbi:MAG: hypothetical protein RI894_174 [Bacteroidota bacterium]
MPYRVFTTRKASLACFYFVPVKFFVQRAALNSKFALLRAKILRKTCPSYHLHVPYLRPTKVYFFSKEANGSVDFLSFSCKRGL